jgi:hypothetical protein
MKIKMNQDTAQVPTIERRRKPRIECQYTATVQGRDTQGNKYEDTARLANLSATGLYMWVKHPIELGEKIFVTVRINTGLLKEATPRIATDGIVTRIDPERDGVIGVAIEFQRYRFL